MKRQALLLLFASVAVARAQAPAPSPAPSADPAPAVDGAEEATPVPAVPDAKKPAATDATDDPYLTNYKKYEHRDERAPGRGPMGKKVGFGLSLGRPLGVTGKLYFTQTIGVQVDLGTTYSWWGPELSASLHVVWHPYTLFTHDQFKLSVYVGGGGRAAVWPLVVTGAPVWLPTCQGTFDTNENSGPNNCRRPAYNWVPGGGAFPGVMGIQGVAGLDLQFNKIPIEVYAQPLVTLDVFPGISGDLGFQVGARWYFF